MEANNVGRPEEDIYVKWIKGKEDVILAACRNGASVPDLCKIIGCKKTTFHCIKRSSPVFSALLKEGREIADYKVENALFKRACGFEYEETSNEVRMNQDGSAGQVISVKNIKKTIPPDTGAAMAWLKNRKPETWRDKQDIDVTVNPFLDLMKNATALETDDE
ncbi:MAG: hypothetical protein LBI60_07320 [Bacteroidales bacterium]|jgi:hypothetical protein|nr:hypothetical protein [Bacteroidales bacterium]